MVGHELRGPLTPILLEASTRADDPATPPALREVFAAICRGVEHEVRLINDLLDAVRLGRGADSYRFAGLDAHEAVARALDACRAELEAEGIALVVALDATNRLINGDEQRLRQVVWNLVRNALKFTPEGGTITVRTADAPGGRLALSVADTGAGIAPEALGRLFDAFEQGDAPPRRGERGLGLGLTIARSIAEAHGGSLTAASPGPGRGATFTLHLPAVTPPMPIAAPRTSPAATTSTTPTPTPTRPPAEHLPMRVLLVEDDDVTGPVLAELLRHDGYEVTLAATVAEALSAPAEGLDCLVSDLDLPDGDGRDLMRQLAGPLGVPGIALTGSSDPDDLRRSRAAGFAAHLIKPIDYPALTAALRRVARPAAVS